MTRMSSMLHRIKAWGPAGLVVLLGFLPPVIYGFVFGRVPQVHADQALVMLVPGSSSAALVDVRPEVDFEARHISGAVSLPLSDILPLENAQDLPEMLRGEMLLLVCDSGVLSSQAARHLRSLGVIALNVRGGMQDWGRAWPGNEDHPYSKFMIAGSLLQEPFRAMKLEEQLSAALAFLWIKPIYMILSGVMALFLLQFKTRDLRLVGWALLIFLVGEIFCAINYYLMADNSYLSEYLHSFSMVAAFALASYALLEGLDERLLHYSDHEKRCTMLPLCGPCIKYQPVRCGIFRVAQLLGGFSLILAVIPLLAPFSYTAYNTRIASVIHYYVRPFVYQWFEMRFSPQAAILLLGLALLVMQISPVKTVSPTARQLLCAGLGFLGFSFFRSVLGMLYAEALIWTTFWEELTELMFVLGVMVVLWVFRHAFLPGFNLRNAFHFG